MAQAVVGDAKKFDTWFKSVVPLDTRFGEVTQVWKHRPLKLRVVRHADGSYYVAAYDFFVFHHRYPELRFGPYKSIEAARTAAEMLGTIN